MSNYKLDTNGDTLLTAGEQGKITVYEKSSLTRLSEIKAGDDFLSSGYKTKDQKLVATGNTLSNLFLINLLKTTKPSPSQYTPSLSAPLKSSRKDLKLFPSLMTN